MDENPKGTPNPLNPNSKNIQNDNLVNDLVNKPVSASDNVSSNAPVNTSTDTSIDPKVEPIVAKPKPKVTRRTSPRPSQIPLDANSSETARIGGEIARPTVSRRVVRTKQVVEDMNGNVTEDALIGSIETIGGPTVADPTNRPMETAQVAKPKKPKGKKIGLIIGLAISLFIAAGCSVAAILILTVGKSGDPVAKAIEKIMTGGAPKNVSYNGTLGLNIDQKDAKLPFNKVTVSVNGEAMVDSMINSSTIALSAETTNGQNYSLNVSEIYPANGDLYIKIDGATALLESPVISDILSDSMGITEEIAGDDSEGGNATEPEEPAEVIDCESEIEDGCIETSNNNGVTESLAMVAEAIEGEWIKVPMENIDTSVLGISNNNQLVCMSNFANEIRDNTNGIAELYSKNSFLNSSSENIPVASQKYPVYQVIFDSEKLTNFVNSAKNSNAVMDLYRCLGAKGTVVSTNNLVEMINSLPAIYLEIDGDNNISRFYTTLGLDGGINVTLDFGFSYPTNINVAEPNEYITADGIMQRMVDTNTNGE